MRVVLTRPRGKNDAFAARLRAAGHETACVPLTRIEDAGPFPDPAGFDGVLFTSAEAVARAPVSARWPRVGAVGTATAAALRARGIRVDVVGSGGGAALAEAWGEARGARLLLPRAERAHPALEEALRAGGAEVVAATVYRTVPLEHPDRDALREADLICFFAPSAVHPFLALEVESKARLWALGETTAKALRAAGRDVWRVGEGSLLDPV